jgi:NAD(P)-dependent dehydrogenase (short-subunit alcohol dehydrogenase family)
MRVLVIGASGIIGKGILAALKEKKHEVVQAARSSGDHRVDIQDPASVRALFKATGKLDAIISAAGGAAWKPLAELTDADFAFSLGYKLMGQVNVIRAGSEVVSPGGSITVTSGVLAHNPIPSSAAVSMVNGGLESFTRAAALELQGKVRVNCISPPWIAETLAAMGRDTQGAMTSAQCAQVYLKVLEGQQTGQIVAA